MEYVQLHYELQVLAQLRDRGGAFAVALPGAEGRALHAKGFDGKRRIKVAQRMGELQVKLHLSGPWPSDSVEFQVCGILFVCTTG